MRNNRVRGKIRNRCHEDILRDTQFVNLKKIIWNLRVLIKFNMLEELALMMMTQNVKYTDWTTFSKCIIRIIKWNIYVDQQG